MGRDALRDMIYTFLHFNFTTHIFFVFRCFPDESVEYQSLQCKCSLNLDLFYCRAAGPDGRMFSTACASDRTLQGAAQSCKKTLRHTSAVSSPSSLLYCMCSLYVHTKESRLYASFFPCLFG